MDNDNAHIISLRNIQQVKRTIIAKEISDHAFLSCTPTSALRRGPALPQLLSKHRGNQHQQRLHTQDEELQVGPVHHLHHVPRLLDPILHL